MSLFEEWMSAKEEYQKLIDERTVLLDTTKNKRNRSGNLRGNPIFEQENKEFLKRESELYEKANRLRKQFLGLFGRDKEDDYDGYFACQQCGEMFRHRGSVLDADYTKCHTFSKCEDHADRTASFHSKELEEIWTR